ncbi:MAG: 2OG-Fe(II) oxygenase [Alcaligenaceae bacterium]|nr:2OG-Fe(II) oxygenase [Alcaligenaceae bacterium]
MRLTEPLIDRLAEHGWASCDTLIPCALRDQLYTTAHTLWDTGHFHQAAIGRGLTQTSNTTLRGDAICWLDRHTAFPPTENTVTQHFLDWTDTLRHDLNQALYLGLNNAEFHFARYPAGAGYTTHIDQHRDAPQRRISLVLYLNPEWHTQDHGELIMYKPDNPAHVLESLLPMPGRLVIFRSDLMPHEVAPCLRTRWSLTGWFRTDHGVF